MNMDFIVSEGNSVPRTLAFEKYHFAGKNKQLVGVQFKSAPDIFRPLHLNTNVLHLSFRI